MNFSTSTNPPGGPNHEPARPAKADAPTGSIPGTLTRREMLTRGGGRVRRDCPGLLAGVATRRGARMPRRLRRGSSPLVPGVASSSSSRVVPAISTCSIPNLWSTNWPVSRFRPASSRSFTPMGVKRTPRCWPRNGSGSKHGQGGLWISDWLPNIAECADDLTVIRSCWSGRPQSRRRRLPDEYRVDPGGAAFAG